MYDYILNLFTSDDQEYRPHFTTPFLVDGNVYATDAHSVVKINKSFLERCYPIDSKCPLTINEFFADEKFPIKEESTLDLDKLAFILSETKWHYKKGNCSKCKGSGIHKCDCCGNENDCISCKGTGEDGNYNFFIRKESDFTSINLFGHNYKPVLLERLLITALIIKPQKIEIMYGKLQTRFKLDNVEIVLTEMTSID